MCNGRMCLLAGSNVILSSEPKRFDDVLQMDVNGALESYSLRSRTYFKVDVIRNK